MTTIDPINESSESQLRDYDHFSDMNPYVGLDSSQKADLQNVNHGLKEWSICLISKLRFSGHVGERLLSYTSV